MSDPTASDWAEEFLKGVASAAAGNVPAGMVMTDELRSALTFYAAVLLTVMRCALDAGATRAEAVDVMAAVWRGERGNG